MTKIYFYFLFFSIISFNKSNAADNTKYLNSILIQHLNLAQDCLKVENSNKKDICLRNLIVGAKSFIDSNKYKFDQFQLSTIQSTMYPIEQCINTKNWTLLSYNIAILSNSAELLNL